MNAERLYRRLLRAFPREFREDVGGEMAALFRQRHRHEKARGWRALARFWLRTAGDLAANAAGERWDAWRAGRAPASAGRPARRGRTMDTLAQDLRYARRALQRAPGFTAVAVLTLALGIGGTTAIFSAVDAVLLRPLPFPDSDRLVFVWARSEGSGQMAASWPEFVDWRTQARSFSEMAVLRGQSVNLSGSGEPERLIGAFVTARLFPLLGAKPQLGRTFEPAETEVGSAQPVAVLSDGLWRRRFGADPGILGRSLLLNGQPLTVVGVMGPDLAPGRAPFDAYFMSTDVWIPTPYFPNARGLERGQGELLVLARLRDGVTVAQADSEIRAIAGRLERAYPDTHAGRTAYVKPLQEEIVAEVRPALLVLLGAVGLVLLIACANVANLLLARASHRHREIAVRSALGAGRPRLVRQLLTESLLLAAAGGLLGLLAAHAGVRGLAWLLAASGTPGLLPADLGIDARVLAFAAGTTLLTGLLFGALPAVHASRTDVGSVLKEGRGGGAGLTRRRFRDALVVWEVALSLMLLIGAGLLMRSALRLYHADPGFRPERLLTWEFRLPTSKYGEPAQIAAFFRQALERVRAVPGVESADLVRAVPLSSNSGSERYLVEGRPEPVPGQEPVALTNIVSTGYFRTMGIPLLRGRAFDEHDRADRPPVVVINATMAATVWPGQEAIGRRLRLKSQERWATVIGVVGDVKHTGLDELPRAQVYSTHEQDARIFACLVARTTGEPLAMVGALRKAFWSVDPDQPVWRIRTMEDLLSAARGSARAMATLVGVFAAVSVLLAAIGLYGVMSYAVALRTREIGIRMALGAPGPAVMRLVVGRGMALAGVAVLVGLAGAAALSRVLATLLFGVKPTDGATFAAAGALMAAVSLLASYLPARRAARLDPLSALAEE
jgi:putative ABC transport system permease protein